VYRRKTQSATDTQKGAISPNHMTFIFENKKIAVQQRALNARTHSFFSTYVSRRKTQSATDKQKGNISPQHMTFIFENEKIALS